MSRLTVAVVLAIAARGGSVERRCMVVHEASSWRARTCTDRAVGVRTVAVAHAVIVRWERNCSSRFFIGSEIGKTPSRCGSCTGTGSK